MVQSVHGKYFSKKKWEYFITHRPAPGSGVSFPEIEVMLCDVPNRMEHLDEQNEADREREGSFVCFYYITIQYFVECHLYFSQTSLLSV
jgi:hypothetical protein